MQTIALDPAFFAADDLSPEWIGSVFRDIRNEPIRRKGAKLERIVCEVLKGAGAKLEPVLGEVGTFDISGERHVIKCCIMTTSKRHHVVFNQIRPYADFDFLVLATFDAQDNVTLYSLPKNVVEDYVSMGIFREQHNTKKDTITFMYTGPVNFFDKFKSITVKVQSRHYEETYQTR